MCGAQCIVSDYFEPEMWTSCELLLKKPFLMAVARSIFTTYTQCSWGTSIGSRCCVSPREIHASGAFVRFFWLQGNSWSLVELWLRVYQCVLWEKWRRLCWNSTRRTVTLQTNWHLQGWTEMNNSFLLFQKSKNGTRVVVLCGKVVAPIIVSGGQTFLLRAIINKIPAEISKMVFVCPSEHLMKVTA